MSYENPWLFLGLPVEEIPPKTTSFVYQITNTVNNRKYIGKKLFHFSKTKQVKGKKKRIKVESDWKTYYGSNKELLADVKTLGSKKFKREIIRFCETKGTANYWEMVYQVENRVLQFPDEWYNEQIYVRVHRSHIKG